MFKNKLFGLRKVCVTPVLVEGSHIDMICIFACFLGCFFMKFDIAMEWARVVTDKGAPFTQIRCILSQL